MYDLMSKTVVNCQQIRQILNLNFIAQPVNFFSCSFLFQITVADFAIYEYLKLMSAFEKTILDKFDWLKTFVANFEVSLILHIHRI